MFVLREPVPGTKRRANKKMPEKGAPMAAPSDVCVDAEFEARQA